MQPVERTKGQGAGAGGNCRRDDHGADWPFAALLLRGTVDVDQVDGVAPEYRASATRYFGAEQGEAWCASLPAELSMTRYRLEPTWVGLLDFDGMRRLPSAIAG